MGSAAVVGDAAFGFRPRFGLSVAGVTAGGSSRGPGGTAAAAAGVAGGGFLHSQSALANSLPTAWKLIQLLRALLPLPVYLPDPSIERA